MTIEAELSALEKTLSLSPSQTVHAYRKHLSDELDFEGLTPVGVLQLPNIDQKYRALVAEWEARGGPTLAETVKAPASPAPPAAPQTISEKIAEFQTRVGAALAAAKTAPGAIRPGMTPRQRLAASFNVQIARDYPKAGNRSLSEAEAALAASRK